MRRPERRPRRAAAEASGREVDRSTLRFVLSGGRHVSPRTIRQVARHLGEVLHLYYATSETGINTMAGPQDLAADPYSASRFMPGVEVRALDPATLRPVEPGAVGLPAIDSAYAMDEYVEHPLDTVQLEGRRYILTSDYGHIDGNGRLYITARSSGGADAVEARLDAVRAEGEVKEHLAVKDVCVTTAAHAPDRAAVVLVLHPGLSDRT